MAHAGLPADRRGVEERPADEHELRAERERFQDIGAAADSAVHHDRHPARLRHHRRERAQRRESAVELPPAVVRHDDAVHAAFAGDASVLRGEHPFQDQAPFPQPAHELQVGPREPVALPVAAGGAGDERDARAHVLEVRHAVHEQRPQEHCEEPAGLERALPGEAQRRPQRPAEAAPRVVLAVRAHRHIHREDQRIEA